MLWRPCFSQCPFEIQWSLPPTLREAWGLFCALYLKGKLFLHRKYLDWQDKFVTEEKCSTLREVRLRKSYRDRYTPKTSCIASFKIDWQIIQLRAFSRKLALLTASINCLKKTKKKVFFYSHAFYSKDHLKNCVHK